MELQYDKRTNGTQLGEESLLAIDDKVKQKDSLDNSAGDQIERDFRRLEKRYRSLLTAIAQIIWTTNADGLVEEDLPTWRAYTGQSEATVQGWGWTEAIHPDDRDYACYVWSQAILNGSQYDVEYRICRYDGVYRTFSVRAVPVFETNNSIREWVGVCTDITERKRIEEERKQLLALEQEANRRMDAFLSMASHELRTPLTGINGYLELAKLQLASFTSQKTPQIEQLMSGLDVLNQIIERAEHHGELLQRLINELLDISRIQMGKLQMHVRRCDLTMIVREVVQDQRQMVPARTILLEMPDAEEVLVLADADRIGQVITNYLTNTFKYSPAGSPVAVRLEVEGQTARVSVRDEGPGLTAQQQEHIWERFYQVEGIETQSASVGGLGLGLYICQTFIERHNGQVGVQSIPGQGSTFWFTLPLALKLENHI